MTSVINLVCIKVFLSIELGKGFRLVSKINFKIYYGIKSPR